MLKKLTFFKNKYFLILLQAFFIYGWMNSLRETSSLFSSYIICGLLGFVTMVLCYKEQMCHTKKETIVIYMASFLYSAAVFLANYNLFIPLKTNVFKIIIVFAGGFLIARNLLTFLCKNVPFKTLECHEYPINKKIIIFVSCFITVATVNLLYLFFVVYPGSLSPDSMHQIDQALNGYTSNHHPFWHTVIVSLFLKIGLALFGTMNAAVATYSVASIFFMALCFSYSILTLYEIGISRKLLIVICLFYALVQYNIAYSVTMWKDVFFGGAALLVITVFFRILKKIGHPILNYIVLFVSGIAFGIWRSNGWLALIFFVLVNVLYCILTKNKMVKTVGVLCAVVLVSWFMRSPVISILNISQPDFVESLSIPIQQIARVIDSGCELNEEESHLLSQVVDIEEILDLYKSYISDPIKSEIRSKNQNYLVENKGEYLKLWIKLGLKYPDEYIKAWVDQTKGYFNGGYQYWIYSTSVIENDHSISQTVQPNFIKTVFDKYFDFFDTPLEEPIRSVGLHVWILCTLFTVCFIKKKKEMLLCVPIIAIIGTLFIATPVYCEFRYAYAVFTTLPFLVVVCLSDFKNKKDEENNG